MNDNLYRLTGKVPFWKALPFSLQQVLCMFVTNLVPIGIVAAAAVPALTREQQQMLIQAVMITAGAATFFQATPIWKFGSGYPIFMGASFTFVAALSAVAAKYGYGAVVGCVLAGGLFEGMLGLTAKYWKKIVAPIVSGLVVVGIGLSLFSTAARSFGGGYVEDFGSWPNLVIGFVTMTVCITWNVRVRGNLRQLAIFAGLMSGYLTAACFGKIDLTGVMQGSVFALPRLLPFRPVFRIDAILSVCIIFIISATETLGDASAIARGALRRSAELKELGGALTIDGFGSFVSGLFGCIPVTSYSENIGLTVMTRVVNRSIARVGACIMILCGLLPPIGRFFSTIPSAVIGGILIVVLGQIAVSGIQIIAEAGFTERNKLIAAISLSMGIGFTASDVADLWSGMPTAVQTVFSQNVVAVIFVTALLLNVILPPMDNGEPKPEE